MSRFDILYGVTPIKPHFAMIIIKNPHRKWWHFWKPKEIAGFYIRDPE